MAIQFQFHLEKTIEAVAILLKLHGQPMEYLALLKMLYIADRIALEQMDQPITGDRYVSMNYGPVLSDVYSLIQGNLGDHSASLWSEFIEKSEYYLSLVKDPGHGELCEEEEEIIRDVYKNYGHLNPFQLASLTHGFQEWKHPHGSAIPISVEDILRNVGKSDKEIEEIQREALRETYLDEVLNG